MNDILPLVFRLVIVLAVIWGIGHALDGEVGPAVERAAAWWETF